MNVFDLFAKLTLDTSDFDKQVENASNSFDDLGDAAAATAAYFETARWAF